MTGLLLQQKMLKVAEKLLERSENGAVDWQKTVDEKEFFVSFPDYSLVIEEVRRPLFGNTYRLSLTNERGTKIESLKLDAGDNGYNTLEQLFHLARGRALDVDERLNKVLKDLEQEGQIG